jgi:biopolymer transport protein ExbD
MECDAMAGISVDEGGKGGRRPLDADINMIPMIDLMMCLIAFLLLTAEWSTMGRINADANVPGAPMGGPTKVDEPWLHVTVQPDEFVLAWKRGGAVESDLRVPKRPVVVNQGLPTEQVRYDELAERVKAEWEARGSHRGDGDERLDQAVLHADNRTPFKELIAVIDAIGRPKRALPGGRVGELYPAMNVTFSVTSN